MSEQIDIELKKEFKKSCFYKKYSVENEYYVDSVLKHIFKEDIEKKKVTNCKIEGSKNYKSATYEQVVEQNCKVIGDYIECFIIPFKEDHNYNKYKRQIENMITDGKGNGIYIDPDSKFNNEEIKDKGFENIIFSYDGLISIKNILDFNEGILLNKDEFIEEYKKCRENPIFFFPSKQQTKQQTINQAREIYFRDRIDYLLFDIKNYLDGKESKMKEIYENGDTKKWLDIVKDKGGFDYLVELYDINDIFVVKIGEEYKILDIEKNDGQSFIEKYREEEKYNWTRDYYKNFITLISKYNGRH